MIGLGWALGNAWGQTTAKSASENIPHKVGLIDMAYLFSHYSKFTTLREELKSEIETADASLKGQLEKIKGLQAEMRDLTPNSVDFVAREKQITEMAAKIEADRKNMQRRFMREETKIYQKVYGEVQDAVNKYAGLYKYTLIVRYSRDEEEGDDPQKIMQALQRQVVYSRPDDDITESVLRYLNRNYENAGATGSTTPTTPSRTRVTDGSQTGKSGTTKR